LCPTPRILGQKARSNLVFVFLARLHCNVNSTITQHIFYDHLLRPQHLIPLNKISNAQIWPSVFLLLCLGLLVAIKIGYFNKVVKIIQSTYSLQALQQLERVESNPFKLYSILLNIFFVFNVSFLVYKINSMYKFALVGKPPLGQFFFFLGLVVLVFLLKLTLNRLLAYLTNEKKVISEYTANALFINQTFGLFLFPLIILVELSTFNPLTFIWLALVFMALAILIKWYRGVIIGLVEERIGLLQIFSYFCGLEILPVFVLVKYVIETF
jgi:hypothetical protein